MHNSPTLSFLQNMDPKSKLLCIDFFSILSMNLEIFTLLLLVSKTALSADPKFEACKSDFNCGSGLQIRYPFWVQGLQEPYCGYPGFNISCKNSKPVLVISGNEYAIVDIDYYNQSLRVSNFESFGNTCKEPLVSHNLTFNQTPFKLGVANVDLFLFSNCSASFPNEYLAYSVSCPGDNSTRNGRSLAFFGKDKALSYVYQSGKCDSLVVAPVDSSWNIGNTNSTVTRDYKYIMGILNKGFQVTWKASRCDACKDSGGICGFDYNMYTFMCFCPDRSHWTSCSGEAGGRKWIKPVVAALSVGASGLVAAIAVFMSRKKKLFSNGFLLLSKKKTPGAQRVEQFLMNYGSLSPLRYKYSEIKEMTNSFRDKLGQGGFGSVFKGRLLDGRMVAVKLLSELKGNGEEFINEVTSISRTAHVNIVTLLGFSVDNAKTALVYEFMPNKSLEKFIYDDTRPHLGWKVLFDIAVGIARGLEYLHRGCSTRILHLDIKPHNILLDQDLCPKISDFGLSKLCPAKESFVSLTGARGTPGFIAPELISRNFGVVSHKSDVYSYGMMVLEMVGGRKNLNAWAVTSQIYFPEWIYNHLDQSMNLGLQGITSVEDEEIARKMVLTGLWCIQTNPSNRPSMSKVLEMLGGRSVELQVPPKPFISSPTIATVSSSSTTTTTTKPRSQIISSTA